jgi:hypothetical protein
MKQFFTYLIVLSIGFNIYFLVRKIQRIKRDKEAMKLHHYKNISHKEGYTYFLNEIKTKYPETTISNKYFIVYRWDSTIYDFIHRDQMKALDSMAISYGKYKFEYVFVTEMEEESSKKFLKRNADEYKNVKMLFGMDDFISGLYSLKNIKLNKPSFVGKKSSNEKDEVFNHNFKQSSLYLIMDSAGTVLHTNGNKFMILKDSIFLNKLSSLNPNNSIKIIN